MKLDNEPSSFLNVAEWKLVRLSAGYEKAVNPPTLSRNVNVRPLAVVVASAYNNPCRMACLFVKRLLHFAYVGWRVRFFCRVGNFFQVFKIKYIVLWQTVLALWQELIFCIESAAEVCLCVVSPLCL